MRRGLIVGLGLLVGAMSFASAADLAATSRVSAVTLYPDGASVTRSVAIDLPAGETTLVMTDFPTGLDPASLRLSGNAGMGVTIGAIDARIMFVAASGPDAALDARLREARDRRDAVDAAVQASAVKKAFIERVAGSIDLGGSGAEQRPLDPAALAATFDVVGSHLVAINEAIRLDMIRIRTIDEEIAKLEAEQVGRAAGRQAMEVRVALSAAAATKATLDVNYLVGGATWTPLYDARLDTATGALDLTRRAGISQTTGEDWRDVVLTISTARATAGAAAPTLTPVIVAFEPPAEPADLALRERTQAMESAPELAAPMAAAAPIPKVVAMEQEATLDTGGFQSVWTLPGTVTIASGAASRTLRLSSSQVKPDVMARAVPTLDTTAYLEAVFAHEEDTPLFPGRVAIYRDGLYAGVAPLELTTRGETVRLGFGADDRITIERIAVKREQSDSGIVSTTRNDRQEYRIAIVNGRTTPAKVSIEEALPVSEDAEITVTPLSTMTAPTTRDADGRRGVLVWTQEVAAGATASIDFGYTISWPAGRRLVTR